MCVPCQTIIWNNRAESMLTSVTAIAQTKLAGGSGWPGDEWGKQWYELIEKSCEEMENMLDRLVAADEKSKGK